MLAGTTELTIDQGTDISVVFVCQDDMGDPSDLTGYTSAAAYMADAYLSEDFVTLTAEITDDTGGEVTMSIQAEQSLSISWLTGYFDVYLTEPSGDRVRLIQGQITFRPQVPAQLA